MGGECSPGLSLRISLLQGQTERRDNSESVCRASSNPLGTPPDCPDISDLEMFRGCLHTIRQCQKQQFAPPRTEA